MRSRTLLAAVLLFPWLTPAGVAVAGDVEAPSEATADGVLDTTYGEGGVAVVDFPGAAMAEAEAVLVGKDGGAILAGGAEGSPDVFLAALDPDGALDRRFGDDGRVVTGVRPAQGSQGAVAIAAQGTDRFLVGASTEVADQLGFAVLGYRYDGTLDPGFGTDGVATALPAPRGGALEALTVDPDGRIVAVGGGDDEAGNATFVAARFTPSGALDPTFGDGGTRVIDTPEGDAVASAVALQDDGKIVLAGTAQISTGGYDVFARLNPDGSNDVSFGDAGLVLVQTRPDQDFGGLNGVAVGPDGRIVGTGVGGTDVDFRGQFATVRLLPDGSPDPSFGNGQGFVTTMVGEDSVARDVVLLAGGEAVAAGAGGPGGQPAFSLVRYRADGSLDEDFGSGGIARTPIGDFSAISDVGLDGCGRLVAAGGTANADLTQGSFAAARYLLAP